LRALLPRAMRSLSLRHFALKVRKAAKAERDSVGLI
jgi:hypothetical protein